MDLLESFHCIVAELCLLGLHGLLTFGGLHLLHTLAHELVVATKSVLSNKENLILEVFLVALLVFEVKLLHGFYAQ